MASELGGHLSLPEVKHQLWTLYLTMAAANVGTRTCVLFKGGSFNQNGSIVISPVSLFFLGEFLETVCQEDMRKSSPPDSSTKKHPVSLLYYNLPSTWVSGVLRFCASSISAARVGTVSCVPVWRAPVEFYIIFRVLSLFVVFLPHCGTIYNRFI